MFAPLRAGDMVLVEIPVSGFIFCAFAYVDDVAFSDRLLVVLPRPQRHSDALTRAKVTRLSDGGWSIDVSDISAFASSLGTTEDKARIVLNTFLLPPLHRHLRRKKPTTAA